MEENKIVICDDEGQDIELYVIEETKFNNMYYILAADSDGSDGECYILKDVSSNESDEAVYEFVSDDSELNCLFDIFKELIGDSDIELSL